MGTPGKITAGSAWPKRLWASPSHRWNEAYSFLRISSSVLPWSQRRMWESLPITGLSTLRLGCLLWGHTVREAHRVHMPMLYLESSSSQTAVCGRHAHRTLKWAWP